MRVVRKIGWIAALIVTAVIFIFAFEPTDAPRVEKANVVGYRSSARGSQYFTVISRITGESFDVGAARGPYGPEYRGQAVIAIRRGRWTGRDHVRFWEGD